MGTSKLQVTGINHVVLHVTDLDRSRTFYIEALGFGDRGSVPGMRASFLRCGAQGLDLFEMADCDVHGGEEMNHMALNVDVADVELLVTGLSEAGIEPLESHHVTRCSSPTRTATGLRCCPSAPASGIMSVQVHAVGTVADTRISSPAQESSSAIAASTGILNVPFPTWSEASARAPRVSASRGGRQ